MTTTPSGIARVWLRACMLFLCLACLHCSAPATACGGMLPSAPAAPSTPLQPLLEYFIDVTGTMDVEEIATPANASAFRPLDVRGLPDVVGVTWLRFTLAPLPEGGRPQALLLDLGQDAPAGPVLYEPRLNPVTEGLEWRESAPGDRNLLLLPESGSEARTCYIRLDGLPGIWFAPMLRTPQNAASDWAGLSGKAALLALGVVMLLCLLRWLSEKGQWRIWTALYVGMALVQGFLGMPAYGSGGITSGQAAAVLSPGLALMLLPHVGRHLLRAKGRSRLLDAQFVLLTLPGAVAALLPLLPGFGWTIRYLSLWPACTIIFTFTALCGAVMGFGGARRFLLGCLIPPLFTAAGILGMDYGFAPELLASAPLWGTALSALLIAGTGLPRDAVRENDAQTSAATPQGALSLDAVLTSAGMDDAPITLDQPLDDPNLRLLPPVAATPPTDSAPRPMDTAAAADIHAWENLLRPPLDRLMREGAALGGCSLPPAVRQYAENMLAAAGEMAQLIDNPGKTQEQARENEQRTAFNLQHLVREAHDSVAPAAENAGIGIAWYMPPLLGHMYEGQVQALRETLDLLLESAVRATTHGAVHLSVRRVPESADPGHLLFTVTDTGSGIPPRGRSSLALTRAWELAGANNGYLTVECGPQGASIAFTLHLTPLEAAEEPAADAETRRRPTIAVVADNAVTRQTLARMITSLGCRSTEARSMHEALQCNREAPAMMVVAQPAHNTPAEGDALGRFEAEAMQSGLPVFKALAVTTDDSQWDSLAERGYTHALLEPVDAEAFAATVREVLDEAGLAAPADNARAQAADGNPLAKTLPEAHPAEPLPDLFGTSPFAQPGAMPDIRPTGPGADVPAEQPAAEPDDAAFFRPLSMGVTAEDTPPRAVATGTLPAQGHAAPMETAILPDAAGPASPMNADAPGEPADAPGMPEHINSGETAPSADAGAPYGGDAVAEEFLTAAGMDGPHWDGTDTPETPSPETGRAPVAAMPPHGDRQQEMEPSAAPARPDIPEMPQPPSETPVTPEATDDGRPTAETATTAMPGSTPLAGKAAHDALAPDADSAAQTAAPVEQDAAGDDSSNDAPLPWPPQAETPPAPSAGEAVPAPQAVPPQNAQPEPLSDAKGLAAMLRREGEATLTPVNAHAPRHTDAAPRPAGITASMNAWNDDFDEWVGEPMPIGTPVGHGTKPAAAQEQADRPAAPPPPAAPASPRSSYVSPSLTAPGEWVGEPMPVTRPERPAYPRPEEPELPHTDAGRLILKLLDSSGDRPAHGPAEAAGRATPAAEKPTTPNGSKASPFMNFIAGAAESLLGSGHAATADTPPLPEQSLPEPAVQAPEPAPSSYTSVGAPVPTGGAQPENGSGGRAAPTPSGDADQTIPQLVARLDAAMQDAQQGFKNRRCIVVGEAAERIAAESDAFGFRVLARMARCVERAAKAGDLHALQDLLPELAVAVERNRIALTPRR
ncbi:response regulator [uncultured Desulfovibrio sp.]|uniref:response regulator n=1 Tax=uncultured Desulfovibrio sp. TaxID=167968 RepID=UPI002638B54A|nr:response regulator [uncultured Desulfovibrio sp.]